MTRLWPARSKWYLIGLFLGIEVGTMEAIKGDCQDISDDCLSALLRLWLRGKSSKPTWKNLVDVLKSPRIGVQLNMESTGKVLCM